MSDTEWRSALRTLPSRTVAARAGCSPSYVRHLVSGSRDLTRTRSARRIALAVGLPENALDSFVRADRRGSYARGAK